MSTTEYEIKEEIDKFSEWGKGWYSPRTISVYKTILMQYLAFYGSIPGKYTSIDPASEVEIVKDFLDQYSNSFDAKAVASYAIRAYYSFKGYTNIKEMLPKFRQKSSIKTDIFSSYYKLWKGIMSLPFPDRAVLGISYALALRLNEPTFIKVKDILRDGTVILVHREKGPAGSTTDHMLPLSPCAVDLLKSYLDWRDKIKKRYYDDNLFIKEDGSPVNRKNISRYFNRLRVIIGEGNRFHQLRHTRATELAERYGDALFISKFLGHKNFNTAIIYIHTGEARKQYGTETNYWHCDKDVSIGEWKWIPV